MIVQLADLMLRIPESWMNDFHSIYEMWTENNNFYNSSWRKEPEAVQVERNNFIDWNKQKFKKP